MSSPFQFDATQVAPQTERTAWIKAKYEVEIVQSELKANSKGTGQVINFGRKAFKNLSGGEVPTSLLLTSVNIRNTDADAEKIGRSEMSTVCYATDTLKINSTGDLHNKRHIVDVDVEFVPDKNGDKDDKGNLIGKHYNRIKAYYKADGSSIVATTGQPVAAAAAPDWAKQQGPPATPPATPAPPTAAPAPPPPPAPAPPEPLYYINHKGANMSEIPENLAAVKARNLPVDEIFVCQFGTTDWVKGSLFAPLAVPAAPPAGDAPPWEKKQP